MKILIGCEESGVVTSAFRKRGFEAYSCDLQPTRGNPDWHYQEDIMECIYRDRWALTILHPTCDAMALSGNRWYGRGMPLHQKRVDAIQWTLYLWSAAVDQSERVALENPKSVIFPELRYMGADVQFIQPWQFGHGECKETGFALHNLPRLEPTNVVPGREQRVWKMPPGPNRKRDRSRTYDGVADAMADQWGKLLQPFAMCAK